MSLKIISNFWRKYSAFIPQLLLLFFAIFSAILIYISLQAKLTSDNHLVLLTQQLIKGKLELSIYNLPSGDIVEFFDKRYLYFGPLPSLLLLPFVLLFGSKTPQQLTSVCSVAVIFLTVFSLVKKFKFNKPDALWLAVFFVFSSVVFPLAVVPITAYQVQILALCFLLLAVNEHFGKNRIIIVGFWLALAGLTRITMYLSLIYFLWEELKTNFKWQRLLLFLLPVLLSFIVLGSYNYKRFHSFLETGYKYNMTLKTYPMNVNIKYGFLSLNHLPANLYAFLLKAPEPLMTNDGGFVLKFPYLKINPWGLAIWYTSPLFLYLLFYFPKKIPFLSLLVTTVTMLVPSLLYFGIGFSQIGYRYSLDALPFLFLLLLPCLGRKLDFLAKSLIILGVIFMSLYMASPWDLYPHFNIY